MFTGCIKSIDALSNIGVWRLSVASQLKRINDLTSAFYNVVTSLSAGNQLKIEQGKYYRTNFGPNSAETFGSLGLSHDSILWIFQDSRFREKLDNDPELQGLDQFFTLEAKIRETIESVTRAYGFDYHHDKLQFMLLHRLGNAVLHEDNGTLLFNMKDAFNYRNLDTHEIEDIMRTMATAYIVALDELSNRYNIHDDSDNHSQ